MAKEAREGKTPKPRDVRAVEVPNGEARAEPEGGAAAGPKPRTAVDDVIAAIEAARDKVMADEVKALSKLGIPRAMAYQMVAARFHQTVVTDTESGTPEFDSTHWNDR